MTSNPARRPSVARVVGSLARAAGTSLRRRYQTITPSELDAMIRSEATPTIVDVRLADDFRDGHIDGALSVPYVDFDEHRGEVPRGAAVVTVCYLGMLSRTAAQHLVSDGHENVFNLDRGMKGWREFTDGRSTRS